MRKLSSLFSKFSRRPKPLTIETPRLILRELDGNDAKRLHEMTSAPGFFYWCFDGTKEKVDEFLKYCIDTQKPAKGPRTEYMLGITDKKTGELIGHVSIESRNLVGGYTREVNFFMDPTCQSKGFGREAALNIMHYGIQKLGLPGYAVTIHPENKPSLRVAELSGYTVAGSTTLETTAGLQPRLILVLTKENFYNLRANDNPPFLMPDVMKAIQKKNGTGPAPKL